MTCPKCYSSQVDDKDHEMERLNHSALHHGTHALPHAVKGHPLMLIIIGTCWLGAKAMHTFSHRYICKNPNCGHCFS